MVRTMMIDEAYTFMFLPLSFRNSSVKLSSSTITSLCEAMTKDKDMEGQDIVFLIDEISYKEISRPLSRTTILLWGEKRVGNYSLLKIMFSAAFQTF